MRYVTMRGRYERGDQISAYTKRPRWDGDDKSTTFVISGLEIEIEANDLGHFKSRLAKALKNAPTEEAIQFNA